MDFLSELLPEILSTIISELNPTGRSFLRMTSKKFIDYYDPENEQMCPYDIINDGYPAAHYPVNQYLLAYNLASQNKYTRRSDWAFSLSKKMTELEIVTAIISAYQCSANYNGFIRTFEMYKDKYPEILNVVSDDDNIAPLFRSTNPERFSILTHLKNVGIDWENYRPMAGCFIMLENKDYEMIDFWYNNYKSIPESIDEFLFSRSLDDVIMYIHETHCPYDLNYLFDLALEYGVFSLAKDLLENNKSEIILRKDHYSLACFPLSWAPDDIDQVIDMLDFLRINLTPLEPSSCEEFYRHVKLVHWIERESSVYCLRIISEYALFYDQKSIIDYLLENHGPSAWGDVWAYVDLTSSYVPVFLEREIGFESINNTTFCRNPSLKNIDELLKHIYWSSPFDHIFDSNMPRTWLSKELFLFSAEQAALKFLSWLVIKKCPTGGNLFPFLMEQNDYYLTEFMYYENLLHDASDEELEIVRNIIYETYR